jgi:opacity protein-like surface antigen
LPPKTGRLRLPARFIRFCFLAATLVVAAWGTVSPAQDHEESPYYGRVNSLGILGAYSWDSSHMVLGYAENRRLVNIGVSYSRRLLRNRIVNWQYDGELLPVALESDPVQNTTTLYTSITVPSVTFTGTSSLPTLSACYPESGSGSIPGFATYTFTSTCGRRWTIGEAISPIGFRWNFLPRRKLQMFADGHGGYMYSTQPIPLSEAGSFNFTFDLGAGFELYRTKARSIRAEYRYHHISNHNTATYNPGIDSGLFQLTYSFGFGRQ